MKRCLLALLFAVTAAACLTDDAADSEIVERKCVGSGNTCDVPPDPTVTEPSPATFVEHMRSMGASEEEIAQMQADNLAYDLAGCAALSEAERSLLPTCGGVFYQTILCHCNSVKCGTWASPPDSHTTAKRAICSGGAAVNRSSTDKSKDIHFGPGDASCGNPTGECWSLYCGTPANNYSLWYPPPPTCASFGAACSGPGVPPTTCCASQGLSCLNTANTNNQCCGCTDSFGNCLPALQCD